MPLPRWISLPLCLALAAVLAAPSLAEEAVAPPAAVAAPVAADPSTSAAAPTLPPAADASPLQLRLEGLAAATKPQVAGFPLASVPVLVELYRQRGFTPLWQRQGQVTDLLAAIARSPDEGLSPSDFQPQAIEKALGGQGLAGLSGPGRDDADLLLTDSLLRYVHHRQYGKLDPAAIDRKLNYAEPATLGDLVTQLDVALDAPDLADHLTYLVREPAFYARLKVGLARYRTAASNGGWAPLPAGVKLAPGARDPRVPALRERLRSTGEYRGEAPADPKVYDPGLADAVKAFQKSQGLPDDGVVGGRTLTELNVPVDKRIDQIRINLERMRWVYRDLPDDYLLVDLIGFRAYQMRGAEPQWSTRVQIGRADRQTPTFRDQVEYLELNPTWTVPPTILKNDILPKARTNPGYVAKKGLKAIDRNGRTVPLSAVNWNLPAGSFPYSLRQDGGGAKAALGKIKFMFPNRFAVYLHDTPSRHLFNQPVRMTSSGCVRVDQPFELAERVLGDPERWSQEDLKAVVGKGKTRTVRLKEPLDIILAYWTADGREDGAVRFRRDMYGRDEAVLTALAGDARMRVQLPPPPPPAPEPLPVAPESGAPAPAEAPIQTPVQVQAAPVAQTQAPEVAAQTGLSAAQGAPSL